MRLSDHGCDTLKRLEGFGAIAYQPVTKDKITIGYGFTVGVNLGDRISRAEADARLVKELSAYEHAVWQYCTRKPNQNQFDAFVLLCWNIGIKGFSRSTVLKAHNRGDEQACARAFGLWNKSGGKVYKGLTRRRAEEAALYLTPILAEELAPTEDAELQDMPQTVDVERPMTASTINRASVVAGGTATVATIAETARTVTDVKYSVAALGDWLVPLLLVVVIVACGYIVWERVNQRKQGWA